MQNTRQMILRAAEEQREVSERSLKQKSLKSLRDYRRVRSAQRRLIANKAA